MNVLGAVGKNDCVVIIDRQGIIRATNRTALKTFNYKLNQLVGKNVRILMPSPYREQHEEFIAEYWRSGKTRFSGATRLEEAVKAVRGGLSCENVWVCVP